MSRRQSNAGKSKKQCFCCDKSKLRDFRWWVLNSFDGPLPEGWIAEIHDLTTHDKYKDF